MNMIFGLKKDIKSIINIYTYNRNRFISASSSASSLPTFVFISYFQLYFCIISSFFFVFFCLYLLFSIRHIPLTLPALSPTMKEGRISKWTKSVGDQVRAGDSVAEIETDKATVDFQVVEDGYLARIFIESSNNSDKMVQVGELIGVMVEEKNDIPAFKNVKSEDILSNNNNASNSGSDNQQKNRDMIKKSIEDVVFPSNSLSSNVDAIKQTSPSKRIFISPLAKKTALESGININDLSGRGSGPDGRIIKSDVIDFISSKPAKISNNATPSATITPTTTTNATTKQDKIETISTTPNNISYIDIPVSDDVSYMAAQSIKSKREIPHYYLNMEIEINELLKLREKLNGGLSTGKGSENKISVNDFIVRASAISMQRVPIVNASWMGNFIRQYNNCNINISVAEKLSNDRIITSSILLKNVESKGLLTISSESKELASKLLSDPTIKQEIGTFTITNLGSYGIKQYAPIIRQPQAASLGVGSIRQIIVPSKGKDGKDEMRIQSLLPVTLSCDHRVVDGAVSAQWLQHFRNLLQNPMTMLL